MRLSTRDPPLFHWHFFIGVADLYLGRMGSALESLRKSVEINQNLGLSDFLWAGALALKGLSAEAAEVCAAARRLSPELHHRQVPRRSGERTTWSTSASRSASVCTRGLRLAGVPES